MITLYLEHINLYLHGESGATDGQHLTCHHGLRRGKKLSQASGEIVGHHKIVILKGRAPVHSIIHKGYPLQ